jgi:outer membrane protein assembly factor BamB
MISVTTPIPASGAHTIYVSSSGNLYVLDAANGTLMWKFSMGAYTGATISNSLIYVSSRDQYLYALQTSDGAIRWRSKFSIPICNSAVSANGALYITLDGAYALDGSTGKVIWHKPLDNNQSVDFMPVTVVGNVVYLGRTDGEGNSTIYALNAATGATYWQTSAIRQVTPLVVA